MIMTVNELAKLLRLDVQTIYRKVKRGEIPCSRIGKTIRFDSKDISKQMARDSFESFQKRKGVLDGKPVA